MLNEQKGPKTSHTLNKVPFVMANAPEGFSLKKADGVLGDSPLIADIGGGHGHLLNAVLDANPHTSGILFELPHVISEVAPRPDGRLELHPGDFFTDPLPSFDTAVVMQVLHDWNDDAATAIIRAIRTATDNGGKLVLLHNTGPVAHWLEVNVRPFSPGAVVTVVRPGSTRLVREVQAGGSYLSSEDPRLHFGLGDATRVREVVVQYPGGRVEKLRDVSADRLLHVG